MCLDNFERLKKNFLSSFNEQIIRDNAFTMFKEKLNDFETKFEQLKNVDSSSDPPNKVYASLGKQIIIFEEIKQKTTRYKKAVKIIADFEFPKEWNINDNEMVLKFIPDEIDFDIHDKIKNALGGEIKKMVRDSSYDTSDARDRGRSFLGDQSNQNYNLYKKNVQQALRTVTPKTQKDSFKSSLFINPDNFEYNRDNSQIKSMRTDFASEKDSHFDAWRIPSMRTNEINVLKSNQIPETEESFVKKYTESSQPLTSKQSLTKTGMALKTPQTTKSYVPSKRNVNTNFGLNELTRNVSMNLDPNDIGCISNQAIDETKLKLIINELKTVHNHYPKIELINNTFKCNYLKTIKSMAVEPFQCHVVIDESKNKMQIKTPLSKKDLMALRDLNVTILGNCI